MFSTRGFQALKAWPSAQSAKRLLGSASSSGASKRSSGRSVSWVRTPVQAYMDALRRQPLVTKMATASAVAGVGDASCQMMVLNQAQAGGVVAPPEFSLWRTTKFAAIGACLAPVMHYWFLWLSRAVVGKNMRAAAVRVALDQFVFTPLFMPTILCSVMLVEGRAKDIPNTLRHEYVQTLISNWMLWTPAQLINFRYVPAELQVLFANGVAAVWNGYLSFIAHKEFEAAAMSPIVERGEGAGLPQT